MTMATKLKQFDFTPQSRLTNGEKAAYPWEDWFDGDIWEIKAGEDFDGNPLMMERIIRTRAVSREAKVTLRHLPLDGGPYGMGTIVLQRTDIEGPETRKRREANEKRRAARKTEVTPTTAKTKTKPTVGKAPVVKKIAKANGAVSKKPARKLTAVQ